MTALVALKRLTIYTGCCVRFPASILSMAALELIVKPKCIVFSACFQSLVQLEVYG
ncbi:hypothetical protein I3843_14G016400 [Carya illinoinensis]|nr:hypothetical protein I3843_14G016400 [Carya illinoinensis]